MSTNAAKSNGNQGTPKVIRIVVDFTVDEDLWDEMKSQGYTDFQIVKDVEKSMRISPPKPCWDYEVQYMKAIYENVEDDKEHERVVNNRIEEICEEAKTEAAILKLPKDSELRITRAAQVAAWRDENRDHYNNYMKEWQQKKAAKAKENSGAIVEAAK